MKKNAIRVIIVFLCATIGLLAGAYLNSVFGGVDFSFSPVLAIVFALAAVCIIICEALRKK